MPPKKDKKPRKPRAKKEKKEKKEKKQTQTQKGKGQKQTQTQIVNVNLGGRGKPRAKSAQKASQIPQSFIRMNAPAVPLPLQPNPPMREPLKEKTEPSRLVGLPYAEQFAQAFPFFEGQAVSSNEAVSGIAKRGRPPLDPAVIKQRQEDADMEREKKRMEREQARLAKEASKPPSKPRGRPKKSDLKEGGGKMGAETDSGYEN
jgi:hypothetical protein